MTEETALPVHTACFACSEEAEDKIQISYRWNPDKAQITGDVHFGTRTQGPPGHVHGGAISSVLDEAMGFAAWLSGCVCVAVNLNINFREMLPLKSDAIVTAWVDRIEGRKVHAAARLTNASGHVYSDSTGLFITIPAERLGNKAPGTLQQLPPSMG